mgnify:CR=1 FL=1
MTQQKVKIRWLKEKTNHIPGDILEVERDLAVFLIAKGDAEEIQ